MKLCIDLFAGLGGFSTAFDDADDWHVITVEENPKFNPDIQADILTLTHEDIMQAVEDTTGIPYGEYDTVVILASPPCTAFTQMAGGSDDGPGGHVDPDGRPNTETGRQGILLAHYTRGLCRALDPDYYFIENPLAGMVNQLGRADAVVWWCQYGHERAKPTGLWGRFPVVFEPRKCHNGNEDCHHIPASRGSDAGTQSSELESEDRARIPYGLSAAILEAVEDPRSRVVQTTAEEWLA